VTLHNGTDGQTDRQTDRQSAREEGRIIICRNSDRGSTVRILSVNVKLFR